MSDPDPKKAAEQFAEQWRAMRDAYMEAWGKAMAEGVNTDAYSRATGAMLDAYLTASLPFRETVERAMVQALQQLSMPSRTDVTGIAERLTHIEMRLDDLDIKLDQLLAQMEKLQVKPANGAVVTMAGERGSAAGSAGQKRDGKKGTR